jgi:antitoxin component of MazEF toxin-antitoxin module
MDLPLRRIGNSLGVIVPREALDCWALGEGDLLQWSPEGIRPRQRKPTHQFLDDLKRLISLEVVSRFDTAGIRRHSLQNLARWKRSGVWCAAYDEWHQILSDAGDGELFEAMIGRTDRANRLRQSMPYVGMLPRELVARIREEAAR